MHGTLERQPLGQHLLQRSLITQEQLDRALLEQNRSGHQLLIGEILVKQQVLSEEKVMEVLAATYGIPFAQVSPRVCDPAAVGKFPQAFLQKHQVLPLFNIEGMLTVAVAEPANLFVLEDVARISGCQVQAVAACAREINSTLKSFVPEEGTFLMDDLIPEVMDSQFKLLISPPEVERQRPRVTPEQLEKLVQHILHRAAAESATDVHIEPGADSLRIRFRIDGQLVEKLQPPVHLAAPLAAHLKDLSRLHHAAGQDGSLRVRMGDQLLDVHVSAVSGRWGEKLVLRLTDKNKNPDQLEKLGFSYDTLKVWRKLISSRSGLILLSGTAGNGVMTTLYASLIEMDRDALNLCTIEDSIRQTIPGVNQFEANATQGRSCDELLKSVLTQDPDVVMIWQITDGESARLAAQAAMNGRLVLAGLRTVDAPGAIARMLHLGVEPYLLGAALTGVLSQRLARKLCQSCREPHQATIAEKRQFEKMLPSTTTLHRARGCASCRQSGYSGRMGVHELLVPDENMSQRISQGATLEEIRQLCAALGMKTLRLDAIEKAASGITTLDEAIRVTA